MLPHGDQGLVVLLDCKTSPACTSRVSSASASSHPLLILFTSTWGPKRCPSFYPQYLPSFQTNGFRKRLTLESWGLPGMLDQLRGAEEAGERLWTHRCHPSIPSTGGEGDSLGMTPRQRQPAVWLLWTHVNNTCDDTFSTLGLAELAVYSTLEYLSNPSQRKQHITFQ